MPDLVRRTRLTTARRCEGVVGRSGQWLLTGGLVAVALAGCGASASSPGFQAATAPATPAGGAVVAACWEDGATSAVEAANAEGEVIDVTQYSSAPEMRIDPSKRYTATLETNKGSIEVEFLPGEAPQTVNNFVCLARDGFYDGTPFHRVVKGFMVQGGDPTGTGTGGPGYRFADEAVQRPYTKGTLAMANAGPNTNGSQFFIMLEDYPLPPNYTIFGRVVSGQEVVDALGATPTRRGAGGENSTPTEPLRVEKVTVTEE